MALETEPVSPRASQLPPLPAHAPLPAAHWATLLAIADTVIAAVVPAPGRDGDGDGETAVHLPEPEYRARLDELRRWAADGADERLLADYLAENASAIAAFGAVLQRMLAFNMAQKQRSDLAFVLGLLE